MHTLRATCKEYVVKLFTFLCFHTGLLTLLNRLANTYQPVHKPGATLPLPAVRKRPMYNLQILTYHAINDQHDPFFAGVPVHVFAQQMDYLAHHANVLPLAEAVARMQCKDLPANAVAVTFDDGYRDVYVNAFPIMQAYTIPATIFLATDSIGSGNILWHDRVFSAFRETRDPYLVEYGPKAATYPLGTTAEKLRTQHEVLGFLRSLDDQERLRWIARLEEQLHVRGREDVLELMLNWGDVQAMARHGISFGSHTVTHPILSKISRDKAVYEVAMSKRVIEEHTGQTVTTFAYPNGRAEDFTRETQEVLQETGYLCALTTIFGTNDCKQDLYALRRGQPWEEDLPTFATKLSWYKFAS